MEWLKNNIKSILLISSTVISFAWTTISLILDLSDITTIFQWKYSALVGFVLFVILVCSYIYSQQKQLNQLRSPKLDITYDDGPPYRHAFTLNRQDYLLYRIGIANLSGKTIEDINVYLEHLSPQEITFSPVKLKFMHQQYHDDKYNLNPGQRPSLFVDVIQTASIGDPPQKKLTLQYEAGDIPNILEQGEYQLSILAEGKDVQPCRKTFLVNFDGEIFTFQVCNPS